MSTVPAEIKIKVKKMSAQKLDDTSSHSSKVVFNIGVSMEETSRRVDSVGLGFAITIDTEPSVAKITLEGTADIIGGADEIEKLLTHDSNANVPNVLTPIYQEVYPVLFMMVSTLDLPYPSPALLNKAHVALAKQK